MGTAAAESKNPSIGKRQTKSGPQQQIPAEHEKQPESDQRGTEQSPLIIKMVESPNGKQEASADEQERKKEATNGWSLSDIIAASAVAASLLQCLTLIATIVVMSRTARRQLRAYVGVASASQVPSLAAGQKQVWGVSVTGYGQTPAFNLRCWGNVIIGGYPLATPLPVPQFQADIRPINPGQTVSIRLDTDNPLTAAEEQEIRAGTRYLYLYGEISYSDIFSKRRKTAFRYRYGGKSLIAAGYGETCEEGNEQT
jgi:hypothetical protein